MAKALHRIRLLPNSLKILTIYRRKKHEQQFAVNVQEFTDFFVTTEGDGWVEFVWNAPNNECRYIDARSLMERIGDSRQLRGKEGFGDYWLVYANTLAELSSLIPAYDAPTTICRANVTEFKGGEQLRNFTPSKAPSEEEQMSQTAVSTENDVENKPRKQRVQEPSGITRPELENFIVRMCNSTGKSRDELSRSLGFRSSYLRISESKEDDNVSLFVYKYLEMAADYFELINKTSSKLELRTAKDFINLHTKKEGLVLSVSDNKLSIAKPVQQLIEI